MEGILERITENEKLILREISWYFSNETGIDVSELGIKSIKYSGCQLMILLSRPGLLIGKKGKDIEQIKDILEEKLGIDKLYIHVEESQIDIYLSHVSSMWTDE